MGKVRRVRPGLYLFLCLLLAPLGSFGQATDDARAVLTRARQSYYNLRSEGLAAFECNLTPDWDLLLRDQVKQNPAAAKQAIDVLSQLRFTTGITPNGAVTWTHNDLPGQNQQMMDALRQIYGGMEQMVKEGFFPTWNLFMLTSPFPEVSSQYRLEPSGAQYRLAYKDGTADVVTTMAKDLAITEMLVTTSEFHSSIRPTFTPTPKGFRLSAYNADYTSQKPEEETHLKISIDYQDIQGLSLPQKLNLSGTYGASSFLVEVTFNGCQATRKQSATAP